MGDLIAFSKTQNAESTPFDNSINGFTAEEVQTALEEVKNLVSSSFIDTVFSVDISIPSTKVLILKDIITSADIILNGELYLL